MDDKQATLMIDQLEKAWANHKGSGLTLVQDHWYQVTQMMAAQCQLLEDIRDELRQMNQANEPDPDAEPDPFQTLNGPRL